MQPGHGQPVRIMDRHGNSLIFEELVMDSWSWTGTDSRLIMDRHSLMMDR